jgi:hypothetical protein
VIYGSRDVSSIFSDGVAFTGAVGFIPPALSLAEDAAVAKHESSQSESQSDIQPDQQWIFQICTG